MTNHTNPVSNLAEAELRAFILRVRMAGGAEGVVVTVDDVEAKRKTHFLNLEDAFTEIREALNLPGERPGQPH